MPELTKDLIVVAADSQMTLTIATLLQHRRQSLAINELSVDVVSHPNQDPGCRTDAGKILDPRRSTHDRAMVIFDFDGCGERRLSPADLEISLENHYASRGRGQDCVAFIVVEPELETWLFGASYRRIEGAVGWSQSQGIQDWLIERGYLLSGSVKPADPKAAIEAVLYRQRMPRSAKLFADLARTISLTRCQDRAFQKFRDTLQRWFPAQ